MLKNMKISERLILGFSVMFVLIIVSLIAGISSTNKLNNFVNKEIRVSSQRKELANEMIDNVRDVSLSLGIMVSDKQKATIDDQVAKIGRYRHVYDSTFDKYSTLVGLSAAQKSEKILDIERIKVYQSESRELNDRVIKLIVEGNYKEANDLLIDNAIPKVNIWLKAIYEILSFENLEFKQVADESARIVMSTRFMFILLGAISMVLAIAIALIITRSISGPLRVITSIIETRDGSVDITEYQKGVSEFNVMIRSFQQEILDRLKKENEINNYRDQLEVLVTARTSALTNVLVQIKETVNVLASASSQILAATVQVAAGTAETATAITETSTTVEEVQQATKQSAQKARVVAESAQLVSRVSLEGHKAVEETVKGMNRIREQMDSIAQTIVRLSEQSQSIGGIIASVTDIADQSNLLSVNAAIEAAKAGEQGKGFAVVAQEIKNLAGQSKQATLQVRNILNDIQKITNAAVMATEQGTKAVEAGVIQSVQAGNAIRILSESSNEAVLAATQIVASSQQQVVGMDQISVAMQNINQAGTETAVSMEQSEKSAKNLNDLGQNLKEMIEQFKI
jgi:methyl-accepting chemotaxis protein